MRIGDYFTEVDRILSLLLIAVLGSVVCLRSAFITEYQKMPTPLLSVADANALIYGVSLLEIEKQVLFVSQISLAVIAFFHTIIQLLSVIAIIVHLKLLYYFEVRAVIIGSCIVFSNKCFVRLARK